VKEDMTVSSHDEEEKDKEEEEEGEGEEVRVVKKLESLRQHEFVRKRTFEDLEPQEQSAMKRSIILVQRWLDSNYESTLPDNNAAISDCQVPGLILTEAPGAMAPRHSHPPVHHYEPPPPPPEKEIELRPADEEALEPEEAEVLKEQPQLTASDFNRGKRLKRLLKLLSGRQATKALTRLRLHARLLLAGILVLHTVCFIVVVMAMYQQYSYATNISSAGQAIVETHLVGTYSRDIEAASRNVGLNVSYDMNYLYGKITSHLDNLGKLHNGLYLGFDNKPTTHQQKFSSFWTSRSFVATEYDSSVPPKVSHFPSFQRSYLMPSLTLRTLYSELDNNDESVGPRRKLHKLRTSSLLHCRAGLCWKRLLVYRHRPLLALC
jgi:hypothetical protein